MGIAIARSERADKKIWHSRLRAHERDCLVSGRDIPSRKEVSNPWCMAKDGKRYVSQLDSKWFRK